MAGFDGIHIDHTGQTFSHGLYNCASNGGGGCGPGLGGGATDNFGLGRNAGDEQSRRYLGDQPSGSDLSLVEVGDQPVQRFDEPVVVGQWLAHAHEDDV